MNSSQWSEEWTPLGGPSSTDPQETRLGDPAVASDVDGRLNVFVVNSKDEQLYYRRQTTANVDTSTWSSWTRRKLVSP
jgi:hypothetical protein